jgi:SAM-dependent methyltransferase
MREITDQVIFRVLRMLKSRPDAFRFVKRHLSNTAFHRAAQNAVRNVDRRSSARRDSGPPAADGADRKLTGHWDHNVARVESKELKGWLDWEFIEVEHIRPQLSGDKSVYYLQHFFRSHLPRMPVARALSLGCGGGNLERALIQLKAARTIDAFDASPESIRVAAELADKEGKGQQIRYRVADINKLELEPAAYDFVVAKMSLHHFEDLDHVYGQIRRALKPGGVFMFNEYVGPTRFQWTDLQLELANRILQTLPREFRRSAFSGDILADITRPTIDEMIRMDPTEAVDSAQILPLLARHFEIVEHREYGGTLLHLVLNHVMANFDVTDELQASLVKMIFLFEQTLVEQHVLDSDFCYVVARPLPGS